MRDGEPLIALCVFTPPEANRRARRTNTILPETETPGEEQAGAVEFLSMRRWPAMIAISANSIAKGSRPSAHERAKSFRPAHNFAALNERPTVALLKTIEKTDFF